MSWGCQLEHTKQFYLDGPNATNLHTVDVWRPESMRKDREDGKLWLMFVNPRFLERHSKCRPVISTVEHGETPRWIR